jgi:protein MpaA
MSPQFLFPTVAHSKSQESRDLRALLHPLREFTGLREVLTPSVVGELVCNGRRYEIPRLHFSGPKAGRDQIRLGLFAGIHGDEPAGCSALVQFAAALASDPARAGGYELMIYPVINPTGYERGIRENHAGLDLNREFWCGSMAPEVRLVERELRAQRFDGIITLHADDTCEGVYGYAHGRTLEEALLRPALKAAARFLPLDGRAMIDGFAAREGLIQECFQRVLSAPPEQRPRPFDLILETPAHAPFGLQVSAVVAALDSIISTYPGFIAYAQDI